VIGDFDDLTFQPELEAEGFKILQQYRTALDQSGTELFAFGLVPHPEVEIMHMLTFFEQGSKGATAEKYFTIETLGKEKSEHLSGVPFQTHRKELAEHIATRVEFLVCCRVFTSNFTKEQ
jgi:hypothetical protein